MAKAEQCILTNMCMITDAEGRVLVQDRVDPRWRGLSFPGGHVAPGEPFVDSVIREVREETGLTIQQPRLCGLKQFQTDRGERYVVLLFKADRYTGELKASDEGAVFWLHPSQLGDYALTEDFDRTLQVFMNDTLSEFCYYQLPDGQWRHKLV